MVRKRRIAGAAAGCAVVLATAMGTPSVSAQYECVKLCEPGTAPGVYEPGYPVTPFYKIVDNTAFYKISDTTAFSKLNQPFYKINGMDGQVP